MSYDQAIITLGETLLWQGNQLPEDLSVDTRDWEDGVYTLQALITNLGGKTSAVMMRVKLGNWAELTDDFLPPIDNAFWGQVDRSLTSAESEGWLYVLPHDQAGFSSQARRTRVANTEEFLEWEMPRLTLFAATLRVRSRLSLSAVSILVSDSGSEWHPVAYEVGEHSAEEDGWHSYLLRGSVDGLKDRLRLVLHPQDAAAEGEIQVEKMILRGARH